MIDFASDRRADADSGGEMAVPVRAELIAQEWMTPPPVQCHAPALGEDDTRLRSAGRVCSTLAG